MDRSLRFDVEDISSSRDEDEERIEDALQVHQLEELCSKFSLHNPPPVPIKFGFGQNPIKWRRREPGLVNKEELRKMLSQVLPKGHKVSSTRHADSLFAKLDTSCDGFVDWNELCTYVLLQLREKDLSDNAVAPPVHHPPKIKHLLHNRQESTTRVLVAEAPLKYITVSKEGSVSVVDGKTLKLEKNTIMQNDINDANAPKRRFKQWVTDAAYLSNVRKFVLATTGRDLRFFDATSTSYNEEYAVYGLTDVPCCLHYETEIGKPSLPSTMMWGDDAGNIHLFTFLRPTNQLFDVVSRPGRGVTKLFFKDFNFHTSKFVSHRTIDGVHPEAVRRIAYISDSEYIVSSSSNPRSSVVVIDPHLKKKTYTFKLTKSIECFALSKVSNVLVTGGNDRIVRLWNPYVVSKPIAVLTGHAQAVLDVIVHDPLTLIFSYSRDAVVKVWDLREHVCVQTINIHFTCVAYGRLPEHGPFPLKLHLGPPHDTLVVACNDYMAQIRLGRPPSASRYARSSHSAPLAGARFNKQFNQVVSAAEDSSLAVWDVFTGRKLQFVRNTHGNEEVTSITTDSSGRRVATGARNGTVKIWSTQTAHQMHSLNRISDQEITGVVHLPTTRAFLTVGWSRRLTTYDDASVDTAQVSGHVWGQHNDDILAVSHSPPSLVATGSFDGEIVIWSLETEGIFARVRRPRPPGFGPPRTPSSRPASRRHRPQKSPLTPAFPAPVDALLFLQKRIQGRYRRHAATLVSSDSGLMYWWRVHGTPIPRGKHKSASSLKEVSLCLATDDENKYLISGDSAGYVFVWNIENFLIDHTDSQSKSPKLYSSWLGHNRAVVSVDYAGIEDVGKFIVTASTDHLVGLWTLEGHPIGTFGQKNLWDIVKFKSVFKTQKEEEEMEKKEELKKKETDELISFNNDEESVEEIKTHDTQEIKLPSPIFPIESINKTQATLLPSNGSSSTNYSRSSTILGLKVERQLSKVTDDRANRRKTVESLNTSTAVRIGTVCCPYQALNTPSLADADNTSLEYKLREISLATLKPSSGGRKREGSRVSLHLPAIKGSRGPVLGRKAKTSISLT